MKYTFILLLISLCCTAMTGQLTEEALALAVSEQHCDKVAAALDSTELTTGQMRFHGAICYYRNGNADKALPLFAGVRQAHGELWQVAAFWEAKIYASQGRDSLALALLHSVPRNFLNEKMLAMPEFVSLAQTNADFQRLKASVSPGFNLWTTILGCIAILGLAVGVLLFFGRSRFSRGERWLSVVVLAFGLILISYVLIWTRYTRVFPYLSNVWPFLTLCVGPALLCYLRETFREPMNRKEILLHFAIPFLSLLLTIPAILRDFGIQHNLSSDFWRIGTSSTLLTSHLLCYAVYISIITQNEWQVDTNIRSWTRIVSRGMWVYTLAFLSYFVLVSCSFFNPEWDYAISFTMALGILGIAYMGLIQKRVFSSEPIETFLPSAKYQSSSLTQGATNSIKTRLERLMAEQQVFKENELRLDDLAAYLDVTRHQLSQVINAHYGMNFFELINRYRVAYVKKLLSDPAYQRQTIIQIAFEAGFNNKASFNRYFKQETGMTPSDFRVRAKEAHLTR